VNTDIGKHIVGFTGIDGILHQSRMFQVWERLFTTLMGRNLVVPRNSDDDDSSSDSSEIHSEIHSDDEDSDIHMEEDEVYIEDEDDDEDEDEEEDVW
jgi:hypothetical protein